MTRSSDTVVRFAKDEDAKWCKHTLSIETVDVVETKIRLKEFIVAELDGEPVGVLEFQFIWQGHHYSAPYISGIIVLKKYQRQGVGRSMLGFLECYLREKGFTYLLSSSQLDELDPQKWHRHMGFEDCGILTGTPTGPASEVFFRKSLK